MGSGRVLCILGLAAFGCGGEGKRASGEFSFTASPAEEVLPCRTVSLGWNVPGADVVNIEGGGLTLISTYDQRGTVISLPICETTTFELTARGAGGTRVETITVTPAWGPATIDSFTSVYALLVFGDSTPLNWSVTNAARVVMTRNEVVLFDRILTPQEVAQSDVLRETGTGGIDAVTTTLVLTASNQISTASAELRLTAEPLAIRRFAISQPAGYEGDRIVLTWEAEGAETMLLANNREVTGWTGALAGTFELTASPPTDFQLMVYANAPLSDRSMWAYINFSNPIAEVEPNDDRVQATPLGYLSASGTLSVPGDVDFFIADGPPLRIWTAPRTGTACALFPTLTVFRNDGIELGRVTGSNTAEGPMCSVLDAELHPFLDHPSLRFGYTISVSGDGVQTGDYLLFIEDKPL